MGTFLQSRSIQHRDSELRRAGRRTRGSIHRYDLVVYVCDAVIARLAAHPLDHRQCIECAFVDVVEAATDDVVKSIQAETLVDLTDAQHLDSRTAGRSAGGRADDHDVIGGVSWTGGNSGKGHVGTSVPQRSLSKKPSWNGSDGSTPTVRVPTSQALPLIRQVVRGSQIPTNRRGSRRRSPGADTTTPPAVSNSGCTKLQATIKARN